MELVTVDLDGTLIKTTVFQAAAEGLGFGEEIARFDKHYFSGVLSLEATFMVEHRRFQGLDRETVHRALAKGPWVQGIQATVQALRSAGKEVWVVTDQPDWAVGFLARWGIEEGVYASTHPRSGGEIGSVERYAFEKWPALADKLDRKGIAPAQVCHVGNGSNDIPVFENVGRGVAFNPSDPSVQAAAVATVEGDDLRDVLPHVEG